MKTIETRALRNLSFREAKAESGLVGTLVGHAAVFNSDSLEFSGWGKPWVERIAPGAFARTLKDQPDVKALWSHRADAILARSPNTLRLSEDNDGLAVEIDLIDTQQNRDVFNSVRSGIVDSMSFGFSPVKTEWAEGKDRDTRTLLDVDLFEVSVVVWPAYPDTSISARSATFIRSAASGEGEHVAKEREAFFRTRRDAEAVNLLALRGRACRFI